MQKTYFLPEGNYDYPNILRSTYITIHLQVHNYQLKIVSVFFISSEEWNVCSFSRRFHFVCNKQKRYQR